MTTTASSTPCARSSDRTNASARRLRRAQAEARSLGSQQGNAHLHWHLAPLPPGVPYEQQQRRALSPEHGVLDVDDASQAKLAQTIRSHL